ncbi:hypothetical protein D3C72_2397730 [compost metagenome]
MFAGRASAPSIRLPVKSAATAIILVIVLSMIVSPLWFDNGTDIFIAREYAR